MKSKAKKILSSYKKLTFLQGTVFATCLLAVAGVAANSIPGFFTFTSGSVISSSEINSNFNKLADLIESQKTQFYTGAWDASTNTPDIFSTLPNKGDYYIVTKGGTQNSLLVSAGDWAMWNGSVWERIIMPTSNWLINNGNIYTSTSNVGIGISTPAEKLHVNNGNIYVSNGSVISETFHPIIATSTAAVPTYADAYQSSGIFFPITGNIGFSSNGVEKMRIDSAGNVGIGGVPSADKMKIYGAVTSTDIMNATSFVTTSDKRLKKNIVTIEDALDKIMQLRGVEFDWKKNNSHEIGLIAQEVESIIPDLVVTDLNGQKAVKYSNVVPLLIESTKSIHAEVQELRAENKMMKSYFCAKDPSAPFCEE